MWTGRTWRFLPAWLLQVKRKANSREEANNGSILSLKLRVRNRGETAGVRVAAFVVVNGAGSTEGGLRVSKSLSVHAAVRRIGTARVQRVLGQMK